MFKIPNPNFFHAVLRSKWLVAGFLSLLGILIPFFIFGATIFDDNFDAYTPDLQLGGQGDWYCPAYNNWWVSTETHHTSFNSIAHWTGIVADCSKTGNTLTEGEFSFWVKLNICANLEWYNLYLRRTDNEHLLVFSIDDVNGECFIRFSGRSAGQGGAVEYSKPIDYFSNWKRIQFRWKVENEVSYFAFKLAGEDWQGWFEMTFSIGSGINSVRSVLGNPQYRAFYWDTIGGAEPYTPPGLPPLRIWGESPVSGTEITNLSTNFTFNWEGLDPELYGNYLLVNFRETRTGITTKTLKFKNLGDNGSTTTPLSSFEFDKNSRYYFEGFTAGFKEFEEWYYYLFYEEFPELLTGNRVDPVYYLDINIEGFPMIFYAPTWEDWYAENTPYATSTALFSSIANFLDPTLSSLGEFGSRVGTFLNLEEAYQRGYGLGLVFPVFIGNIKAIEFLFGGFPIVKMFFIIIALLLGIFVFKLILKLIPGLG